MNFDRPPRPPRGSHADDAAAFRAACIGLWREIERAWLVPIIERIARLIERVKR